LILTRHLSGFAVVFAEDVPDVASQDYTNSTLTLIHAWKFVIVTDTVGAWMKLCPAFNAFTNATKHD
jgi:hypothetical protein